MCSNYKHNEFMFTVHRSYSIIYFRKIDATKSVKKENVPAVIPRTGVDECFKIVGEQGSYF